MAIVLDEYVESAPVIKTKIAGGTAIITLGANQGYDKVMDEAAKDPTYRKLTDEKSKSGNANGGPKPPDRDRSKPRPKPGKRR